MNASNMLFMNGPRAPFSIVPRERLGGLAVVVVAHVLLGLGLIFAMHRTVTTPAETEIAVHMIAPPKPLPLTPPVPRPMAKTFTPTIPVPVIPQSQPVVEPVIHIAAAPTPAPIMQSVPETHAAPPAPASSGDANPLVDASAAGNAKPVYPRASRALGEQGVVVLEVFVTTDGTVGDIRVNHSSGFDRLDESALHAVRQWHFIPARQGGKQVAMWYKQPITFDLKSA